MSFLDPTSDVYRRDWVIGEYAGAVGGCLMGLAVALFFFVLVRSLLAPRSAQAADAFALPDSAAYHDEDAGVVRNFGPWVAAGVIAILLSYIPPLVQVLSAGYPLAAG
jgi:heme/copper-type cytochrome/quinol oxidase subunit 1